MNIRLITTLSALTLFASACSGGSNAPSGSQIVPVASAPTAAASTAPSSKNVATAQFTITVPFAKSAAVRKRHYVSPATQSIGIVVTPQGGTALPATIVNVTSPSCVTNASGITCSIAAAAPIGTDVFALTTYDQPNATGNVLSSGSITGNVVSGFANSFPLVLGGTIAKIVETLTATTLPVGVAGSTTLSVAAYDASNNQIAGTYTSPIALSAPAGITLGTASIASSSTASTSVAFDGKERTALAITASSGSVSSTTSLTPTTNVVYYPVPAGVNAFPFKIVRGPDGAYYFGESFGVNPSGPANLPGRIGRIDTTGAITEVQLKGIAPVGLLFVGNDLYFAEENSSSVGRITGAASGGFTASNYSELLMPNSTAGTIPFNGSGLDAPRSLVEASDGNIYVANYYGYDLAYFSPSTFTTAGVTEIPANPSNGEPQGLAVGANGSLYSSVYNFARPSANVIDTFAPRATAVTSIVPTDQPSAVPAQNRFITEASDGNLYFTELDASGSVPDGGGQLTQYNPSAGTFTSLKLASPYALPDSVEQGPAGTVLFSDLTVQGIGIAQTSTLSVVEYPLFTSYGFDSVAPQDVQADPDGSYWFTAPSNGSATPGSPAADISDIGHLILAQGWTVYPAIANVQILTLGVPGEQVFGIAGSATSGVTFTATSSNTAVCTVAPAANSPLNFVVTGVSNGACSVAFSDGTRTSSVAITVTNSSATISTRKRKLQ
jgi:streptogramin lyase